MKARLVACSSLFVLAACSSSGGNGTGAGGASAGGSSATPIGGTNNPSGGTSIGNGGTTGSVGGNTSTPGGTGGTPGGGGTNPAGGAPNNGGTGGTPASNGGSGGVPSGTGGSGGMAVIPSTCGMPVAVDMGPRGTCANTPPPALKATQIIMPDQISNPLLLTSPPGDMHRQFVITRAGKIHIIKDGALLPDPFLDITDIVTSGNGESEPGLLGLAFDPAYDTTGKFWIFYSVDGTADNLQGLQGAINSILAVGNVSAANPDLADKASLTTLLTVGKPADNHNGGMINFGTDGCLFVTYGDGGDGDDNHGPPFMSGNGQNTTEPLGSILRVDPATGNAAPGNPGYMEPRIWIYGVRNPWRWSFDRMNGDMYVADVGQNNWEEVDISPAGMGDINYGWAILEGTHMHGDGATTGMRPPVKEYDHNTAQSITGGYVYRGSAIPGLVGRYIYGDYKKSKYWSLTYTGEMGGNAQICDDYDITTDLSNASGPTGFGQDGAGELYITTLNNGIYKIEAGP
ncbi:MAG TPA: PQQ-dependent sugar dehydrogenase [Polyangiaceae bacterium]|nr:PQQ-dependent sugar dehydrogenase [Polyangiaceae bacterium]